MIQQVAIKFPGAKINNIIPNKAAHSKQGETKMITKKHLLLLCHLRQNSRQKLKTLAEKTNLSVSTVKDMLKRHEKELIKKHTALIDFRKLGFFVNASLIIRVKAEQKDALKEHLKKNQNVNSVYTIDSDNNFLVEVIFRSISDLEDFKESIKTNFDLTSMDEYYIVDELKKESFMSDPSVFRNSRNPDKTAKRANVITYLKNALGVL